MHCWHTLSLLTSLENEVVELSGEPSQAIRHMTSRVHHYHNLTELVKVAFVTRPQRSATAGTFCFSLAAAHGLITHCNTLNFRQKCT